MNEEKYNDDIYSFVDEIKREEYDIFLIKDDKKLKLNDGHCYTLTSLIVDWFDKIDDQFTDYPFYGEVDEEMIVRMYFIFYGHGLYEITKNGKVIYCKLL